MHLSPWSFAALANSACRRHALAAGVRANLIVVATSGLAKQLPEMVESWLGKCLSEHHHPVTAVIAFLGACPLPEGGDSPWLQAVKQLAAANGCAFFRPARHSPDDRAAQSARSNAQDTPGGPLPIRLSSRPSTDRRQPAPAAPLKNKMTSPTSPSFLVAAHQRTFEAIFRHPLSHSLAWRDVFALFRQLGHVAEETNGNFKITRNGQTLVLPPPRQKDITDADELVTLRHFIQRSDVSPVAPPHNATPANWLLVINHHEARIFRADAIHASAQQVLPQRPEDFFRHAHNSKDFARGREKPDPNSFFGPVAKALRSAEKILIFGGGTGTASEMEQFTAWLKDHAPDISDRVVGTLVVDEHHRSDAQLLAQAREFFAQPAAAGAARC